MKYLTEDDFLETIEWRCPYKNCQLMNEDSNDFGIRKEYVCRHCKRTIKVKLDL